MIFPHLNIEIERLPRAFFPDSSFPIYFYGVIIALGIYFGLFYATKEAKRTGQNSENYSDFLLFVMVAAIIGARGYYVLFSGDDYSDNYWRIFAIREGGLAIYGAVIASILTAYFFTKRRKIEFWLFADTCAPGLILGQALGRWGNFFNKEAFGRHTDSLFAMKYLESQVGSIPASLKATVESGYIQVHPTFLYESLACISIFLLMNVLKFHKKFDGEIFVTYLVFYGTARFFIEGLRTDQLLVWGTNIAISQIVSALLIIIGILIFLIRRKNSTMRD